MTNETPWWRTERHNDRRPALLMRNRIKSAIRAWFEAEGFIEIDASALQISPGNETHLHAFKTQLIGNDGETCDLYLQTSPEFACKKLIAAGERKIFTFAPAFRNRERGHLHAPAFTMLEWYRADNTDGDPYRAVQNDCDQLLAIAAQTASNFAWRWKDRTCDLHQPSIKTTVPNAMLDIFGFNLMAAFENGRPDRGTLAEMAETAELTIADDETWGDIFSKLMVELEKRYAELPVASWPSGIERSLLLDRYPACMSPLARTDTDTPNLALRFELFVSGIELANGFGESNDPDKVRAGLETDMAEKQRLYGERYPIDDDFIAALPNMPPSTAGCAMGFDRLVMLATGATNIEQVLWTPMPK